MLNTLADEFADGNELDSDASMYVDEKLRIRSVFNILATQNVLRLKVSSSVLATMSLGEHIKVGCEGKVVRFSSTVAGKLAESTVVEGAKEQNGCNRYWRKVYPSSEVFAAVNDFRRWPVVHFNAGKLGVESFSTVVPEITSGKKTWDNDLFAGASAIDFELWCDHSLSSRIDFGLCELQRRWSFCQRPVACGVVQSQGF